MHPVRTGIRGRVASLYHRLGTAQGEVDNPARLRRVVAHGSQALDVLVDRVDRLSPDLAGEEGLVKVSEANPFQVEADGRCPQLEERVNLPAGKWSCDIDDNGEATIKRVHRDETHTWIITASPTSLCDGKCVEIQHTLENPTKKVEHSIVASADGAILVGVRASQVGR